MGKKEELNLFKMVDDLKNQFSSLQGEVKILKFVSLGIFVELSIGLINFIVTKGH